MRATNRLKEWALDWVDRTGTRPAAGGIEEPLTLVSRIFAALAGVVAVLSSPAIDFLAPNLNANAAAILRVIIALGTLVAVNYVVTAKDTVESEGHRKYRFSNTERLIARGIVVLAILIWSLNFVPAPPEPRDCSVNAVVTWKGQLDGTVRPLSISLVAGQEQAYPIQLDSPVAMRVPSAHLSRWSINVLWSDNSLSGFGEFSGCPAAASKGSGDGRAEINLTGR
jgi:hypothetical protein